MYMIEEFFYAALDIKQISWAQLFISIISNKYPNAPKSMRLLGMLHESSGDLDKAKEIYNELITINANDG